eukprot:COSAG06_NODE_331_length_17352_cov_63.031098_9_plen_829_part_00
MFGLGRFELVYLWSEQESEEQYTLFMSGLFDWITVPSNGHAEDEAGLSELPIFDNEEEEVDENGVAVARTGPPRVANFRLKPMDAMTSMIGENGRLLLAGFNSASMNNGGEDEDGTDAAADTKSQEAQAEYLRNLAVEEDQNSAGNDTGAGNDTTGTDASTTLGKGDATALDSADGFGHEQGLSDEAFKIAAAKLDDEEAELRRRLNAGGLSAEEEAAVRKRLAAIDKERASMLFRNRLLKDSGRSGAEVIKTVYALAELPFLEHVNMPPALQDGLQKTKDWSLPKCQSLLLDLEKFWASQGKDSNWFKERLEAFRCGQMSPDEARGFLGGGGPTDDAQGEKVGVFVLGTAARQNHDPRSPSVGPFSEKVKESTTGKRKSRRGKRGTLGWGAAGPHEAVVLNDDGGAQLQGGTSSSEGQSWERLPFAPVGDVGSNDGEPLAPWFEGPGQPQQETHQKRLAKELAATQWARNNAINGASIDKRDVLETAAPPAAGDHARPSTVEGRIETTREPSLEATTTMSGLTTGNRPESSSAILHDDESGNPSSRSSRQYSSSQLRRVRSEQWHIGRRSETGFHYVAPSSRSLVSRRTTRPHTDWGGGFSATDATRSVRKEKGRAKHLRELRAADVWSQRVTVENVMLGRRAMGIRDTYIDLDGLVPVTGVTAAGDGVGQSQGPAGVSMDTSQQPHSAGPTGPTAAVRLASLSSDGSSSESSTSSASDQADNTQRHSSYSYGKAGQGQVNYSAARRNRRARKKIGLDATADSSSSSTSTAATASMGGSGVGGSFDAVPVWGKGGRIELMASVPHITASTRALLDPPAMQFQNHWGF